MDKKEPLVHIITNSVTINDTVNLVLAAGGAAICADSPREVAEVVSLCDALMINIGTPSEKKLTAMLIAGRRANEMGIPVVLDPVGAGASGFRREILGELLEDVRFDCIRGNKSEIAALLGIPFRSKGVETVSLELADEAVHGLAEKTGSVILMTGESDLVFDERDKFEISGGRLFDEKDYRKWLYVQRIYCDKTCRAQQRAGCQCREKSGSRLQAKYCQGDKADEGARHYWNSKL